MFKCEYMWRLIVNEGDVYWNMGLDEAMLELKRKGLIPNTLRLYVIKPSAITIGYFQKVIDAINLEYLEKKNISFTRRITGGGSVYHDAEGEITYSVIADLNFIPLDLQESYRFICRGIVEALHILGLEAEFVPINDVVVNGRKISGSAQARRGDAVLQHGTLMYNTNLDLLEKILKVSKEKLMDRGVLSIRDRVTTVSLELHREVNKEEVLEALKKGFARALHVNFREEDLTKEELSLAKELASKYSSREWKFKR